MEDTTQRFDCEHCGAEFSIQTTMDIDIRYCPYCGEVYEALINSNIEYEKEWQ